MPEDSQGLKFLHPGETSPVLDDMIAQTLGRAAAAQADFDTVSRALGESTAQRDAELAAVEAHWKQPIAELEGRQSSYDQSITELWEKLREEAYESRIDDEQLAYVNGLLRHRFFGSNSFDFARADREVERFHQLQPGTKVLSVYYHDHDHNHVGDPDAKIYVIGFRGRGGILSESPRLRLVDRANLIGVDREYLHPVLDLRFSDGRQETADWDPGLAVGDEEIQKVVSIWLEENKDTFFELRPGYEIVNDALSQLSMLAPLQLELPEKDLFQAKVLEWFRTYILDRPSPSLMEGLHFVAQLDQGFYQTTLEELVKRHNHNKAMDWGALAKGVACVIDPGLYYSPVPDSRRRSGLEQAMAIIEEMRITGVDE